MGGRGGRSPRQSGGRADDLLRRRHALAAEPGASRPAAVGRARLVRPRPHGRDHHGSQSRRRRRGLPVGRARAGREPAQLRRAERLAPRAGAAGPRPRLRRGRRGRGRRPRRRLRQPQPRPHLRTAGAERSRLAAHTGGRAAARRGAYLSLLPDDRAGHADAAPAPQRYHQRPRPRHGRRPVRSRLPGAGRRRLRPLRDLQLGPAGARMSPQRRLLAQ